MRLNKITSGLQKSDLIILAARPSMGKTALALNIARNVAMEEQKPVAVFSLEMSNEQLSMRLLTAEARIDSNRLRTGFISQEDWQNVTDAASILNEMPIFIDDTPIYRSWMSGPRPENCFKNTENSGWSSLIIFS